MKIREMKVTKLHGYMEKNIILNDDINILVGINGSGKTSVLNIISMILEPSIEDLCLLDFEKIELDFDLEETRHKIICTKENENFSFRMFKQDVQFPELSIEKYKNSIPHFENNNENRYFHPVGDELITWNYIRSIPKPVIIGLDRNLIKERRKDFASDRDNDFQKILTISEKNPLNQVKKLIKSNCLEYSNELKKLDDNFIDYIVQSTFEPKREYKINEKFFSENKRRSLQKRLQNLIDNKSTFENRRFEDLILKLEEQRKKIDDLFKKFNKGDGNASYNIIINISQLEKMEDVLEKIEKYSEQKKEKYKKIEKYFNIVNGVFENSNKKIYFDYKENEIFYKILDDKGEIFFDKKSIETLSSGEKQILILFTLVAFNTEDRIFIIDEPELSLHPKWQEIFLENVKSILNTNTQLILATHSPGVVGKNRKYCKVLLPLGGDINEI